MHTPSVWLDDYPSREAQIDTMSTESEYDIVVVGGGATGCGVALDAASRGISNIYRSYINNYKILFCFLGKASK